MNRNQMLTKLETALETQNAVNLNVGDKVQARFCDSHFIVAYVHSFNDTDVTFQTLNGFQWLMSIEEASQDTFLVEAYNRESLIQEIKALWLAKVA